MWRYSFWRPATMHVDGCRQLQVIIVFQRFYTRVPYRWVVLYSCTNWKTCKNNCGFTHGNRSQTKRQVKKQLKKKNQTDRRSIDDRRHTLVGPSRMIRGLRKLSPEPHTIAYTAQYPLPTAAAAASRSSTLSPIFIVTKYTRYNYYCNGTRPCAHSNVGAIDSCQRSRSCPHCVRDRQRDRIGQKDGPSDDRKDR